MNPLKQKIENKGIKQRWLAKQMNISFEILNKWLNGKADMPLSRKEQLEKLLN